SRVYSQIREGTSVDEQVLSMTASLLVRSALENPAAATWMALLQEQDDQAHGHALRSATWGLLCARHLGLDEVEIKRLAAGLLLKDIYRTGQNQHLPDAEAIE